MFERYRPRQVFIGSALLTFIAGQVNAIGVIGVFHEAISHVTGDWAVSAAFVAASPHPVFLAGGLTADNVGDAVRTVRPFGLDLCSSVRTAGTLDVDKLSAFMRAVRRADEGQSPAR